MSRNKTGGSRHSKPAYSSAHDFVSVYCAGSENRPHDKWKIATFVPIERDGVSVWAVTPTGYTEPVREGLVATVPIAGLAVQWLIADKWVPRSKSPFSSKPDGYRERWNLTCDVCALARIIASPERMYPALESLNRVGVLEVELHHFTNSEL